MSAPTTQDQLGKFYCDRCGQYRPEAEMMGDDEPICQDCHADKLDEYKDAFDDMFGRPMEALENLTARDDRNGGL